MIRLTFILLFGIGMTLFIAGEDPNRPQGSDQPGGVEVTRLDSSSNNDIVASTAQAKLADTALAIPLNNHDAAVEAALRATEEGVEVEEVTRTEISATADLPPAPETDFWYITGSRVNLRAGPSTSDAVIGQVSLGQEATVLEETADGWFRIETAQGGTIGFIFGKFLSPEQPL